MNPYLVLLGSRVRSQLTYRSSFALDLVSSILLGAFEFTEIYVVYATVDVLGGLDVGAALLVFALSNLAFSFAQVVAGGLDKVPELVRMGTIDALLLRPLPVLGQLLVQDFQLRRMGRGLFAAGILLVALVRLDIAWTPDRVLLLLLTPVAGTLIFVSIFVTAGAVQFFLVDGGEFTNAFVYGGAYASQNSSALLPLPVRIFFGFVVPAAFTGYLPTVTLLRLPAPGGFATAYGWLSPVVAVVVLAASLGVWRQGLRHYTGAGG